MTISDKEFLCLHVGGRSHQYKSIVIQEFCEWIGTLEVLKNDRSWEDRAVRGGHSKRRNSRAESWVAKGRDRGSPVEPASTRMTNRERQCWNIMSYTNCDRP